MYLNCLPLDLLSPLFLYFQPAELSQLLPQVKNLLPKLFSCKVFWQELCHRDISSIIPTIENCEKYIEAINKFVSYNRTEREKDKTYIQYLVTNNYDILLRPSLIENLELITEIAAFNGLRQMIDIILKIYPKSFGDVLVYSAAGGYVDIVREMVEISKRCDDVTDNIYYYENAAHMAAENNYTEVIELLITEGVNDYDGIMAWAAYGGHKYLVERMLKFGAHSYDWVLVMALEGGYIDIAQLMVDKGADEFHRAVPYIARGGHTQSLEFILRFIDEKDLDYHNLIMWANYSKHKNFIDLCIDKCVKFDITPDYNSLIIKAIDTENIDILEYIIQKANNSGIDYDKAITEALDCPDILYNINIIKILLKTCPHNIEYKKHIAQATSYQQNEIVKLLISHRDNKEKKQ
jgi:ankyrin repeat protein